jgi:glycosyltransferase involved in cell wall biosynthesis
MIRSEVLRLLRGARLSLCPLEGFEAFRLRILELFACGVPVVASRVQAMAEIVRDRHTGLLFNPRRSRRSAAQVKGAWEHPRRPRK